MVPTAHDLEVLLGEPEIFSYILMVPKCLEATVFLSISGNLPLYRLWPSI